jgi:hypothetical protein
MALDELQQIAQARANMMMRGYEPLRLEMGRSFAQALERVQGQSMTSPPRMTSQPPREVLGMAFSVRPDMEGFAVLPVSAE